MNLYQALIRRQLMNHPEDGSVVPFMGLDKPKTPSIITLGGVVRFYFPKGSTIVFNKNRTKKPF